mgnify:CR=1 FL=1
MHWLPEPPDGTAICLGFDGSDVSDWTCLTAETVDGLAFTPRFHGKPTLWNPAEHGGRVPRAEVAAAVADLFGRFDVAALENAFGVVTAPVWCTKIASKLVRTFTDRHGLKYLLNDLVSVDVSKQQQTSDWGAADLTEAQKEYAASDVLYLHRLKAELEKRLEREGRTGLAQACFDFLPARAHLDLMGWGDENDIFRH